MWLSAKKSSWVVCLDPIQRRRRCSPHSCCFCIGLGKPWSNLPFGILFSAGVLFTMLESGSASDSSNLDPNMVPFFSSDIPEEKQRLSIKCKGCIHKKTNAFLCRYRIHKRCTFFCSIFSTEGTWFSLRIRLFWAYRSARIIIAQVGSGRSYDAK
jgi:hypothetical protein